MVFIDEESFYYEDGFDFELISSIKDLVYVIYMLGFIGKLKGAVIEYQGLINYIWWVCGVYVKGEKINFLLYLFIVFDLMVMFVFILFIIGNIIIVYGGENKVVLFDFIIQDLRVDIIKLILVYL